MKGQTHLRQEHLGWLWRAMKACRLSQIRYRTWPGDPSTLYSTMIVKGTKMSCLISILRIQRWRWKRPSCLCSGRFKNWNECSWFWCPECRKHDLPLPLVDVTYERCNQITWDSEEKNGRCPEDEKVGWACIFGTYPRLRPILCRSPTWWEQSSLCASRTCSRMYGRCIEGSLDRISRGILAVRIRTVSCACLVGRRTMMMVPQLVLTHGQLPRTYLATSDWPI